MPEHDQNLQFYAKIKITQKHWGAGKGVVNSSSKEEETEKASGSYLLLQESTYTMGQVYGDDDQTSEHSKSCEYRQKEGFRLFISDRPQEYVVFTPEYRLTPLSGEEFPVSHYLPLERRSLKVGESFEVKTNTMDVGTEYSVKVLSIERK